MTMITPSYLGETIEYSSLHACRSTLEDPTVASDIPKALANAKSLRHLLRIQFNFSWDRTAQDLAEALGLPVLKTMLDHRPAIDRRKLAEPADVVEGLETAANQQILRLAETYYRSGDYPKAIEAIDTLKRDPKAFGASTMAMDATLLEAEISLRLNQYPRGRVLIEKVANEAAERSDWARYIRARSVENTILRDQGRYGAAADLAELLLKLAQKEQLQTSIEKIHRLAARSLALNGRWDEAVSHGNKAFELARDRRDHNAEAKAALALGEAYRHGLNQANAVKWYTNSRDLAGRAGNTDCFLWAVLGLADSLFLLDDIPASAEQIEHLAKYVNSHVHPLETLHTRLSRLSIACRSGGSVTAELWQIVEEYNTLGIIWPRDYVTAMVAGDFTHPKRF